VNLAASKALHEFLLGQIRQAGRIRAAHDLSEGGLLVAVAEMLFGPQSALIGGGGDANADSAGLGAEIDVTPLGGSRIDALLFGESQDRVVVSVSDAAPVLAAAAAAGIPAAAIGRVTANATLAVTCGGAVAGGRSFSVAWPVSALRRSWETSIEAAMSRPGLG
jgi:phosphoribosylformylglycinamidine synthase